MAFYEIPNSGSTSTGIVYYAIGPEVADDVETAIAEEGGVTPGAFQLGQNYPNPCNPETVIPYILAEHSIVEIAVYDLVGQRIRVLRQGHQQAGHHQVRWDGNDGAGRATASGVYSVRLRAGGRQQVQKMLLLR